jgi:DNA-binding NarL/FixJ family response regulator
VTLSMESGRAPGGAVPTRITARPGGPVVRVGAPVRGPVARVAPPGTVASSRHVLPGIGDTSRPVRAPVPGMPSGPATSDAPGSPAPERRTGAVRVLLVDDHALLRAGMATLLDLADDVTVVGSVGSGLEALESAAALRPDVVLMDLSMPGMSGVEATRRLLAARRDTAVVVLTSFAEPDLVVDALDAGAVGYLLKDAEPDRLVEAVRAAARGESPLDPRAARIVLSDRRRPAPTTVLSARETEVLVLVAEGLANKQIARALGIAERTVKAHLTSIFNQIGVTDRTSAALWAHRRGLVGAPPPPASDR